MPTAIITGVNGQDGSYLAEYLLQQGYRVVGTSRRRANLSRVFHIRKDIELVELNLKEPASIMAVLSKYEPDEIYNLAARACGSELWQDTIETGDVNGLAATRLLESILAVNRTIRFCQATSSEIFGDAQYGPFDEAAPVRPRNPYGAAKAYAHFTTAAYREEKGMFACSAILFNHESPRRGSEFVTRKITQGVARIKMGLDTELRLGNLDAQRDWGFAGDYVRGMFMMLQQPFADDFVFATGRPHSVREFCQLAFSAVGLRYTDFVQSDAAHIRPSDSPARIGSAAKAERVLGWRPCIAFDELVRMMVEFDLQELNSASAAHQAK